MDSGARNIIVPSYAKVNLTLDVLGLRPDGFHAIESVMQTVDFHDTVRLGLREKPGVWVTCDMTGIPTDDRNLAHKAASLLLAELDVNLGLEIHIQKRIPPEAGLGGGSSNAAAVLNGFSRLVHSEHIGVRLNRSVLSRIALQVGSDVPFFLFGGTAFVKGRGEEVEPLPDIAPWHLVIVKPPFGVPTGWAYRRYDEVRDSIAKTCTASARMRKCIMDENCQHLPYLLSNDLELAVLERYPLIREIKEVLARGGASGSLMCGSGSAVFGLFEREESAMRIVPDLERFGQVFVTHTIGRSDA